MTAADSKICKEYHQVVAAGLGAMVWLFEGTHIDAVTFFYRFYEHIHLPTESKFIKNNVCSRNFRDGAYRPSLQDLHYLPRNYGKIVRMPAPLP
jgi:hypothetical protein